MFVQIYCFKCYTYYSPHPKKKSPVHYSYLKLKIWYYLKLKWLKIDFIIQINVQQKKYN